MDPQSCLFHKDCAGYWIRKQLQVYRTNRHSGAWLLLPRLLWFKGLWLQFLTLLLHKTDGCVITGTPCCSLCSVHFVPQCSDIVRHCWIKTRCGFWDLHVEETQHRIVLTVCTKMLFLFLACAYTFVKNIVQLARYSSILPDFQVNCRGVLRLNLSSHSLELSGPTV
jgi:hypothetical protein